MGQFVINTTELEDNALEVLTAKYNEDNKTELTPEEYFVDVVIDTALNSYVAEVEKAEVQLAWDSATPAVKLQVKELLSVSAVPIGGSK